MRVVVWIPLEPYKNAVVPVVEQVPGAEIVVIDDPARLPEVLPGAAGLITSGASRYTADVAAAIRDHGTNLRWIQTVAAGNEGFVANGVPSSITVTSSGGHSAPVVAEHAMALLLALTHCVPDFVRNTAAGSWNREFAPRFRSMFRKTAVVLGLGNVGIQIANRARAFDMRVLGVTRSGAPHEAVDEIFPVTALGEALSQADAILIALPMKPDTRHVLDADAFKRMKAGTYIVNVARGGIIDQVALRSALESGQVAGAALDVTDPEPLPTGDPLWNAPNLIISPHTAGGGSSESPARLASAVRENLRRLIAGEQLLNILPFGAHAT